MKSLGHLLRPYISCTSMSHTYRMTHVPHHIYHISYVYPILSTARMLIPGMSSRARWGRSVCAFSLSNQGRQTSDWIQLSTAGSCSFYKFWRNFAVSTKFWLYCCVSCYKYVFVSYDVFFFVSRHSIAQSNKKPTMVSHNIIGWYDALYLLKPKDNKDYFYSSKIFCTHIPCTVIIPKI